MLNYLQLSIYKALTSKVILRERFGEILWITQLQIALGYRRSH